MRRTLATLGGLALGFAFSQFPEYAQQYEQRLGGAVDELRIIVDDFDADARKFGLTRPEALQHYATSPERHTARNKITRRCRPRHHHAQASRGDDQRPVRTNCRALVSQLHTDSGF